MALGSTVCWKVAGVSATHSVACAETEFLNQSAEGMDGLALRGALRLGFVQGARRALGLGDWVQPSGRFRIDKEQLGPSLAQMPFDIVGQHTEQDVRTHTRF